MLYYIVLYSIVYTFIEVYNHLLIFDSFKCLQCILVRNIHLVTMNGSRIAFVYMHIHKEMHQGFAFWAKLHPLKRKFNIGFSFGHMLSHSRDQYP